MVIRDNPTVQIAAMCLKKPVHFVKLITPLSEL